MEKLTDLEKRQKRLLWKAVRWLNINMELPWGKKWTQSDPQVISLARIIKL